MEKTNDFDPTMNGVFTFESFADPREYKKTGKNLYEIYPSGFSKEKDLAYDYCLRLFLDELKAEEVFFEKCSSFFFNAYAEKNGYLYKHCFSGRDSVRKL